MLRKGTEQQDARVMAELIARRAGGAQGMATHWRLSEKIYRLLAIVLRQRLCWRGF